MTRENRSPTGKRRGIKHRFTVKLPRHHAGVNPRETCQHCGEHCGDDRGGYSFSPYRPVCHGCCGLPDRARFNVDAWGKWCVMRDEIRRRGRRGQ